MLLYIHSYIYILLAIRSIYMYIVTFCSIFVMFFFFFIYIYMEEHIIFYVCRLNYMLSIFTSKNILFYMRSEFFYPSYIKYTIIKIKYIIVFVVCVDFVKKKLSFYEFMILTI